MYQVFDKGYSQKPLRDITPDEVSGIYFQDLPPSVGVGIPGEETELIGEFLKVLKNALGQPVQECPYSTNVTIYLKDEAGQFRVPAFITDFPLRFDSREPDPALQNALTALGTMMAGITRQVIGTLEGQVDEIFLFQSVKYLIQTAGVIGFNDDVAEKEMPQSPYLIRIQDKNEIDETVNALMQVDERAFSYTLSDPMLTAGINIYSSRHQNGQWGVDFAPALPQPGEDVFKPPLPPAIWKHCWWLHAPFEEAWQANSRGGTSQENG